MPKSEDSKRSAPSGFSLLGQVLASGYCDSSAQYQLGRVLMHSASSVFSSPHINGEAIGDDELVEAFTLVDAGWSRVRTEWARLSEAGERRRDNLSPSRAEYELTGSGQADQASDIEFKASKNDFALALASLADAYQQCPRQAVDR
ncbi:hypothetical protein ACWDR0_34645 [Streptomyces sp. NPDC003691]